MEGIPEAATQLRERRRILVFTGAGISTESGIPDFRGPQGVWQTVDPDEFTLDRYLRYPETRRRSWQMRMNTGSLDAEPNPAHRAVVDLWRTGRMIGCVTQNIDGLHQKAGVPEDKVFELHGNMQWAVCLSCRSRFPMPEVLQRIRDGVEVPDCPDCEGILKPDAVFFGEALPQKTLGEAIRRAQNCDLMIVIGSTLVIYPAAYVPTYATDAGAKLAIVNLTPTPFDQHAAVVIRGKAGEIMSKVMAEVRLS